MSEEQGGSNLPAIPTGSQIAAAHSITHPKKRACLTALAETGNVTEATRAAGVHRRTHYDWLDPKKSGQEAAAIYAEAVEDAMEAAADRLEREAFRRAVEGVDEPVYQGGELVGTVRKYSDTLLIFLLKGARPEKFRERHEHRHSGSVRFNLAAIQAALEEGDEEA